ncbi:MAG: tRNA 4-thiouridine(8) synthase ThiI [Oscillospiraceae bacterium]|jgi:thiamine biosynthesis protein ThiI|nr:tRNA 4-thiouridine(8) synthase ThiI [Oscillospiraceae bacterium]
MKEVLLLKNGEIVLKGLNKKRFEDKLLLNIKSRISSLGKFDLEISQSTITVSPGKNSSVDNIIPVIKKIFGIVSFSKAVIANKNFDDVKKLTLEYLKEDLSILKTFKVEAKRSDKKFFMTSPEISKELGGYILEEFPHLKVDVHNPELTITAEVRDFGVYIRKNAQKGLGGIPTGTGGKASIMISGGIDSPVAAWMMAKRGVFLTAVHFSSPPYTGIKAKQKVIDLLKKVSEYSGSIKLFNVGFTAAQESIKQYCQEEFFTIIMRRIMMKISEIISINEGCSALITGESLGQVASQTINAIDCTNRVVSIPVFRPLIGMDKEEIVKIAREINTFDVSIMPYADCCTVFTPKHPKLDPRIHLVEKEENKLDTQKIIKNCVDNCEVIEIK